MIPTATLMLYGLSVLALAVTPGPTMLLALANGAGGGLRVASCGILGASLASAALIGAVALGLGALLAASAPWFEALRAAGVAYLAWIAWQLWHAPAGIAGVPAAAGAVTGARAFMRSATVALSNPKAIIFFSAFLPQFVDPAREQASQYAVLGTAFVGLDALVMLVYASAGTRALRWLSAGAQRMVHRGVAVAILLLAAGLASVRRAA